MKKTRLIFLVLGLGVIMASCQKKATPEEQLRAYGKYFIEKVSAGEVDSLKAFYPDILKADSLATINSDTILVSELKDGGYELKLNDSISLKVNRSDDGQISVAESRGVFAFPEAKMFMARQSGMWDGTSSDVDLAEKMKDQAFFDYLTEKLKKVRNSILKVNTELTGITYEEDEYASSAKGYRTITNTTDQPISGSDYKMNFRDGTDFGYDNTSVRSEPGKDIAPHSSIHIEGYETSFFGRPGSQIEGNLVGVTILLSDAELIRRFAKFTGNEYKEYLGSK